MPDVARGLRRWLAETGIRQYQAAVPVAVRSWKRSARWRDTRRGAAQRARHRHRRCVRRLGRRHRRGRLRPSEAELHALGDNLVWVEAGARNVNGVRTGTYGTAQPDARRRQAILEQVPEIRTVSPNVDGTVVVVSETHNWTTHWRGVSPDYLDIKRWTFAAAAARSPTRTSSAPRTSCLIGQTVKEQLFGDDDAVGEIVRIGGQPFRVVGVLAPKGQSATGQDQDDTICCPYTTAMKKVRGDGQAWLDDILCSARGPEDIAAGRREDSDAHAPAPPHRPGADDDFNIRHPEEVIQAQIETQQTLEACS